MLQRFRGFLFIFLALLAFSVRAVANDSDVINCNHIWKIAILGSSTAYGTGATTYDSSWVGKFTTYVKRKNNQNEVYNFGIPGFTTYQNLCSTGFVPPANRPLSDNSYNITAAIASHADAIIINMPSNDAANNYTVAEQQANFERAAHVADSAHIPLWIATTQPRNNLSAAQVSNLISLRDWIFTRFGDKAVDFWTTVANGDGSIAAFYDYDYAHVNNAGHNIFYKRMQAENILDTLCLRLTQTLVAKAGSDLSVTLPATSALLNGSGSYSSNGGAITGYSWIKISGPANAVIVSPSTASTNVNNLTEGRYAFSLTVTDNLQHSKSDTVNITVSSRILIDFGPDATPSPDAGGKYWNTVTETQPGIKLSNAVTVGNQSTSIGLQVISRIDGTFNTGGPGTNTGNSTGALNDYPSTATADFAFADPSATSGSWKITGLEAAKQYTIKFWGTRSVADDRVIQIKRADQSIWQEYNAANNVSYNTAAVFSFSGKTEMSFEIRVKSGSAFGYICLIDISRTTPALAVNVAPTARASDVTVALPGTSGILDGSASGDEDGVIVSYNWLQISGPSPSQIVSASAAVTTVNNLIEGIYTFQLTVKDDSNAVATRVVTLTVNSRVLFDIGPEFTSGADAGGKYWNNVTDGLAGLKISNAVNTGNTTTGISFEIINRIDGTFNTSGPGTNTGNTIGAVGDYPASVTTDFAFAHPSTTTGKWKIGGLISTKQYTVKFWGARSVSDERYIQIKRSDETTFQEYDAQNNTDYNNAALFTFSGKTEMSFDIRVKDPDAFGYISLIDLKITNAPVSCSPSLTITSNQQSATCSGSAITFTATAVNGGGAPVYQWKKNGINIPGATASVYTTTTLLNNEVITCMLTASTGCSSGTTAISNSITVLILPIVGAAGNISGPTNICSYVGNGSAVYSIAAVANATTYSWTVPAGASIISGQGTTSITVGYSSGFGNSDTIKVAAGPCTNSLPSILLITKTVPDIPAAITGPIDACPFVGQAGNAVYSIAPVPNATSYTWTVPSGAAVVSGQGTTAIQVSYQNSFAFGAITVTANANCGSRAPRSLAVSKVVPLTPGAVSGPASACSYIGTGTSVTYSITAVANATSYLWTPPANTSIVSGQGTTSLSIIFNNGFTTSALKVRSLANCGSSSDRSLTISTTTAATPGVISGPTNACIYIGSPAIASYSIRKVANVLSYLWAVPAGAVITGHPAGAGVNDTIINVSFNSSFVSGTTISVQSAGCVSSPARSLTVTRGGAPGTPGTISGPTNPCSYIGTASGAVYTVRKLATASSYNWTVPAGANATHPAGPGANDTIISLTYNTGFSNGTLTVLAVNGCGNNNVPRSLAIKIIVPTAAPVIQGPTDPCPWIGTAGATYRCNKIANAGSYTWTVPANGANVMHPNAAGPNDTVIIVNYTSAFTTGNITARADADCGSGPMKTFAITRKLPSVPGNISTTLISSCPDRQYRYAVDSLPANATTIAWSVPAGAAIINGQGSTSIIVSYPATAIAGSVTAAGSNNCGQGTSIRTLNITLPACGSPKFTKQTTNEIKAEGPGDDLVVTAMPNPTFSNFRVSITPSDKKQPSFLSVMDVNGKVIEAKPVALSGEIILIGSGYKAGIYFAEFIQGDQRRVIKLIKL